MRHTAVVGSGVVTKPAGALVTDEINLGGNSFQLCNEYLRAGWCAFREECVQLLLVLRLKSGRFATLGQRGPQARLRHPEYSHGGHPGEKCFGKHPANKDASLLRFRRRKRRIGAMHLVGAPTALQHETLQWSK